jgi:hypothetical protein
LQFFLPIIVPKLAPAQHVGFLPKDWQDTGIGFKALNRFASPARDNPDALCIASASSEVR